MNENINIHDVVSVNRTHIDPNKSYYGSSRLGVVIEIDDKHLVYINSDGEHVDQPFIESEYTVTLSKASEIVFEKEIEKQIERRKSDVSRAENRLADTLEWYDTFTRSISFMGKLMRFIRTETYGK